LFKTVYIGKEMEKSYIANIKNFMGTADLSLIQNDFDVIRPKILNVQERREVKKEEKVEEKVEITK